MVHRDTTKVAAPDGTDMGNTSLNIRWRFGTFQVFLLSPSLEMGERSSTINTEQRITGRSNYLTQVRYLSRRSENYPPRPQRASQNTRGLDYTNRLQRSSNRIFADKQNSKFGELLKVIKDRITSCIQGVLAPLSWLCTGRHRHVKKGITISAIARHIKLAAKDGLQQTFPPSGCICSQGYGRVGSPKFIRGTGDCTNHDTFVTFV